MAKPAVKTKTITPRPINEAIIADRMLVLTPDGSKVGPITRQAALSLAHEAGLDLMLVSHPNAPVPVCKILDYAKYRFDLSKRREQQRKKSQVITKKEIRLKVQTSTNDLKIKINRARIFLKKRYHVKLSLRFRGREVTHPELGYETLNKFTSSLEDVGIIDKQIVQDRMVLSCELKPVPGAKLESI